jgi:hypothetical protein
MHTINRLTLRYVKIHLNFKKELNGKQKKGKPEWEKTDSTPSIFFFKNSLQIKEKSITHIPKFKNRQKIYSGNAYLCTHTHNLKTKQNKTKNTHHQAPVTHYCNPSYMGGWDHEDPSSRPAWANSSWHPISKLTRAKWTKAVSQAI